MSKFIDRTGERYLNNQGCWLTIIVCRGAEDCDVQFEDGVVVKNRRYGDIKRGKIKNLYYPTVYGIGYTGVGAHKSSFEGKDTKMYYTWNSMLQRSYSEEYYIKLPSYKGCSVDKNWHSFQNFGHWYEKNYKEGWHLDKDILVKGNKIYSPETCCIVPAEINTLFVKHNKNNRKYPVGVTRRYNKFIAQISKNGITEEIDYFDTIEEAFHAYKTAKEAYIKEVADEWKPLVHPKVYTAMYKYEVEITD